MHEAKIVSIIIPVYNASKFLRKCVDSILSQNYKSIELILINDGSTDNSGEICESYALIDTRVKVEHISNSGPSNARNFGMSIAQGTYIQFVDSDDFIEPEMTEVLVEQMSQGIDIVICGHTQIVSEGLAIKKSSQSVGKISRKEFAIDFENIHKDFLTRYPWNKLFRSSIIKANDIKFDKRIKWGEDIVFNFHYLTHCNNINIINVCLYNYVQTIDSITSSYHNNYFNDQREIYKEMKNFLIHNNAFCGNNRKFFEYEYTRVVINCLHHLFHPKANLKNIELKSKVEEIIIGYKLVSTNLKYTSIKQKVIVMLIKHNFIGSIIMYFRIKKIVKKV